MKFVINWLGQAGYIIKLSGKIICIDPYLSNIVEKFEGLKRLVPIPILPEELEADYLIITHDHLDHFDEDTIKNIKKNNIIYIGPTSCINHFKRIGINDKQLKLLNRGDDILPINGIIIHGVYAKHTEDSIGIVIGDLDSKKSIYLTGDTEYSTKLYEVKKYKPELLIGCINGKGGNMNYIQLARLAKEIGALKIIPSHYGMFKENTEDPKKLEKEVRGYNIEYIELEYNKQNKFIL